MAQVNGNILIERPVEEVFDYVADQTREPGYNREMISSVRTTEGPIGAGSHFHAVLHSMGRDLPMEIDFVEFERPARIGMHTEMASMTTDGGMTFRPEGDATRMSWSWEVHPRGVMRLATPLVGFIGGRQERRNWTTLKAELES